MWYTIDTILWYTIEQNENGFSELAELLKFNANRKKATGRIPLQLYETFSLIKLLSSMIVCKKKHL